MGAVHYKKLCHKMQIQIVVKCKLYTHNNCQRFGGKVHVRSCTWKNKHDIVPIMIKLARLISWQLLPTPKNTHFEVILHHSNYRIIKYS